MPLYSLGKVIKFEILVLTGSREAVNSLKKGSEVYNLSPPPPPRLGITLTGYAQQLTDINIWGSLSDKG